MQPVLLGDKRVDIPVPRLNEVGELLEPLLFFHKRLEHALHLVIDRLLTPRAGVLLEVAYFYVFSGIYPAGARLKLACDELEQGRLARRVRADKAYLIALADFKAHARKQRALAELHVKILYA